MFPNTELACAKTQQISKTAAIPACVTPPTLNTTSERYLPWPHYPTEVWNYLLCQNVNRHHHDSVSSWSHASYMKAGIPRQGAKQHLGQHHKSRD